MSKLTRALAATVLVAALPATVVLAQQSGEPEKSGDQPQQAEKHRGPSPETLARLEDGRIAMIKTALKLTPEQEKLWAPVEEKMRAAFAERQKKREEWLAKRDERRAARGDQKEKLALPDRIEARSQRMTEMAARLTERAAKIKEYAETLKPLFASFTDEQKDVAARVLARHHGHGRHFAMGGREGRGGHGHEKRWE